MGIGGNHVALCLSELTLRGSQVALYGCHLGTGGIKVTLYRCYPRIGGVKVALKANRSYLKGSRTDVVTEAAREFFEVELGGRTSETALACAAEHQARGDLIVLLSGSLAVLAEPFRDLLNAVDVVASDLAVVDGHMTGRLSNLHPVSAGKVAHARVLADVHGFALKGSTAYADSGSDIPLLEEVGAPFAVNPDAALRRHARAHGWEILDWHGR